MNSWQLSWKFSFFLAQIIRCFLKIFWKIPQTFWSLNSSRSWWQIWRIESFPDFWYYFFRYTGSSWTNNNRNRNLTSKIFWSEHLVLKYPDAEKSKEFQFCWILTNTFFQNNMVQFFHQGLSRQPCCSGGLFRGKIIVFPLRPKTDRPELPNMLLTITDLGFQTPICRKLPAWRFRVKYSLNSSHLGENYSRKTTGKSFRRNCDNRK